MPLLFGGLPVGYRMIGAYMIAAQAQGAAVAPFGTVFPHHHIFERARFGAQTAACADVGCVERFWRHGVAYKPGVDYAAFYPCPVAGFYLVDNRLVIDVSGDALYRRRSIGEFTRCHFRRVDVEPFHQRVSVGHNHRKSAYVSPMAAFD